MPIHGKSYDTFYDIMSDEDTTTETATITVQGVSFICEVIKWNENRTLTVNTNLGDNIVDTKTVILIVEGDLIINAGVLLTTTVRKKGFFIFVKGNIINFGNVSMTARGANALGVNVHLYKNPNDTYEYIPAQGAAGGAKRINSNPVGKGNAGLNGTERRTGGGGSGGKAGDLLGFSGAGAAGTSFSGGAGGGAVSTSSDGYTYAQDGFANGGAGGYGRFTRYAATPGYFDGGAGNPGGLNSGSSGTGGLLVMFIREILFNHGSIVSNGSNGASLGGNSGGGSINIFSKVAYGKPSVVAVGGTSPVNQTLGGSGSITFSNYLGTTSDIKFISPKVIRAYKTDNITIDYSEIERDLGYELIVLRFKLYRNNVLIQDTTEKVYEYQDVDIQQNTSYSYRVEITYI